MLPIILAIAALVLGCLVYLNRPTARAARRVARLEARYLAQDTRPTAEARAALERHVRALEERFPGRDRRWYLERVLADVRRARR